jgi:hypothetical protein
VSLPPGPQVNRTLHHHALFSWDGKIIEGAMLLNGWWRGATPSMSADIRWNGIESLRGGMIIMEQRPHFRLCELLEERDGEGVRCLVIHEIMGSESALVVAGTGGQACHQLATAWLEGLGITEDEVGAVTLYLEMQSD